MAPRPNADFLRGLLAAYALALVWVNLASVWFGLGVWVKYHRLVAVPLGSSLALLAAYAFTAFALAFPGPRRLLAAALLLTAGTILPVVLIACSRPLPPLAAFLPSFLLNEAVRIAAAAGAWLLWRRTAPPR